jgi:hypothetical protein
VAALPSHKGRLHGLLGQVAVAQQLVGQREREPPDSR